jgi:aspartyl protease family protein
MKIALLCTVAVGVVIGVSLPASPPSGSATPAAAADTADAEEDPPVDTGASVVAMTQADAKRAHVAFDRGDFEPVGKGAAGIVQGARVAIDRISLDGKSAQGLRGMVLADSKMSLLGQNYLRNLDVTIKGDTMTLR